MSGIATGTALAIGLGAAGTAASVGTSLYGANKQAGAAQSAAELQAQQAQNSLDFQKQQYADTQGNQKPWVNAGQQAITELSSLTQSPGQGLLQNWSGQFQAPTAEQAAATPGYQFAMDQGLQGVQRGAAARGNLLSGGEQKALTQYGQGLASTNYQQTYNNALTQYQQAYNEFQQGQTNQYNRLAGVAGSGQTATATLGNQGQAAANNVSNINMTSGQQQGNALNNAAYQTASGYGAAAGALGNGLNNAYSSYQLGNLLNSQGAQSAPYLTGNLQPTDINPAPSIYGVNP